jgi:flagellar hook-basal body complex protein FliE
MSDMRVAGIGGLPSSAPSVSRPRSAGGFGETLQSALGEVNRLQQAADAAARDFSLGRTRDVAGTLITIEKANLGFQLALQIRNKLLEAYQEIMRTPL